MRAVADRADVAVGTLYRYFPSKVHLLVTALAREFEAVDAAPTRPASAATRHSSDCAHVLDMITACDAARSAADRGDDPAFVFADASASAEVDKVGEHHRPAARQRDGEGEPTEDLYQIARVVSDVWMSNSGVADPPGLGRPTSASGWTSRCGC